MNFNRQGSANRGSKTGGQMGKCDDAKPQGRPFDGRGQGMGRGQGSQGRGQGRFGGRGKNA